MTTDGEVIKVAAIVTNNKMIESELREQKRVNRNKKQNKIFSDTGDKYKVFIEELESPNIKYLTSEENRSRFKIIVVHCESVEKMLQITKHSEICVVGDYLCCRWHNRCNVFYVPMRPKENPEIY